MVKLHVELIDRLEAASAALSEAIDVIGDEYGSGDELFDKAVEARDIASRIAARLQSNADTYGEMAHLGI